MTTDRTPTLTDVNVAGHYGNMSRVASTFYVRTGNQAELDAAYWYARYAMRAAQDGVCWCGCGRLQHHQNGTPIVAKVTR